MPLSISGLATVRAALVADVQAAWSPTRIYTSAAETETPTSEGDGLPVAAIILNPSRFDSEGNGINSHRLRPLFRIVGRFYKEEGIDLAAAKEAAMQLLLDRLTADWNYHGATYEPAEWTYSESPDGSDAARSFWEVSLDFPLHL